MINIPTHRIENGPCFSLSLRCSYLLFADLLYLEELSVLMVNLHVKAERPDNRSRWFMLLILLDCVTYRLSSLGTVDSLWPVSGPSHVDRLSLT
jgi:hypothetical protein